MRKIKFRVWCKNKNEWEKDSVIINESGVMFQLNNDKLSPCYPKTHIIMQSTGLKDINNKEIYESDIITYYSISGKNIGKIIYREETASFHLKTLRSEQGLIGSSLRNDEKNNYEIIGNIYENLELL